jgi:hypothetical protein
MFLNPLMLAGLGGAALPLVLHLLSRARHRDVQWGAMMFLPGSDARQQRNARIKQIVLLAVRTAIVSLLAVALARPVLAGDWWRRVTPAGPTCTVLLLDCSTSMGYQINGQSRFDLARRAALDVVQNMSSGDEVSLVLLGVDDLQQPPAPSADLRSLALRLSEATVRPTSCDAAAALDAAIRVLKSARAAQRRIVLVSDRQAVTWNNASDAFSASWRGAIAELDARAGARTTFSVITAGGDEHENIAVESAQPAGGGPLIRGQFGQIDVVVHNYGEAPRADVPISLFAGPREQSRASVTLPARSRATVRLSVPLPASGSHLLSVRLAQQGLLSDDRFDLAVDVGDPARVLIISDDAEATEQTASGGAAGYLRAALAPFRAAGERGVDPSVVEIVAPSAATTAPLRAGNTGRCDLVVLIADSFRPTPQLVSQLERFVYDGGGLFIVPGRLLNPEQFNESMYRNGAGLAPAGLRGAVRINHDEPSRVPGISWLDESHPAFAFARGRAAGLRGARIYHHFPAQPHSDARILARLDDGEALLIERRFGRGRVAMSTVPLDGRSSNLPFSNFFLPMVQSLSRNLAAVDLPPRNLLPGQPIEAVIEDATSDRATLTLPDGSRVPLEIPRASASGDGSPGSVRQRVRYEQTSQPGRYELRWRTAAVDRVGYFVVRPPMEESDLTPLTTEQWATLHHRFDFDVTSAAASETGAAALAKAEGADAAGPEAWPLALGALAVLLLIESLLGRSWSAVAGGGGA